MWGTFSGQFGNLMLKILVLDFHAAPPSSERARKKTYTKLFMLDSISHTKITILKSTFD